MPEPPPADPDMSMAERLQRMQVLSQRLEDGEATQAETTELLCHAIILQKQYVVIGENLLRVATAATQAANEAFRPLVEAMLGPARSLNPLYTEDRPFNEPARD